MNSEIIPVVLGGLGKGSTKQEQRFLLFLCWYSLVAVQLSNTAA